MNRVGQRSQCRVVFTSLSVFFTAILFSTVAVANGPIERCRTSSIGSGCLEPYATELLQPGYKASLLFGDKVTEFAESFDLDLNQLKPRPLSEAYDIDFAESVDIEVGQGQLCWKRLDHPRVLPQVLPIILNETEVVAEFLGLLHAYGLGQAPGFVFQVRHVKLCSRKSLGRSMVFKKRTLHIGLPIGEEAFTVQGLWDEWFEGNHLMDKEPWAIEEWNLPKISDGITHLRGGSEAVLRKKLKSFWRFINPVAEPAFYWRTLIWPKLAQRMHEVQSGDSLQSVILSSGYPVQSEKQRDYHLQKVSHQTGYDQAQLIQQVQQKVTSPNFLSQIFAASLVSANAASPESRGVSVWAGNKEGFVNVTNHHVIDVFLKMNSELSGLIQQSRVNLNSIYELAQSPEVKITKTPDGAVTIECRGHSACIERATYDLQNQEAFVGVDTTDLISVGLDVQIPSTEQILAIALYQILESTPEGPINSESESLVYR